MLDDLKVLNGDMQPKFDKYNDLYTVFVNNNVEKLELSYIVSGTEVDEIIGNDFLNFGENLVVIKLANGEKYNLNVIKKQEQTVTNVFDNYEKIEIKPEMPSYIPSLIGIICFLLVVLSYLLIFKKKNK